ncbi:endopeptidase [bacterium]|nr:endopeptidase [bacterium]
MNRQLFQRFLLICFIVTTVPVAFAIQPKEKDSILDEREFFKPELSIPIANVPLDSLLSVLSNAAAWSNFFVRYGSGFAYIDPRSANPDGIITRVPLIPGSGSGNQLTLQDLERQLGRPVPVVDEGVVRDVILQWISQNQAVLGINPAEFGSAKAARDVDHLWQIHIPRKVNGIPVRDSRFMATVSYGNLVLAGVQAWGPVLTSTTPGIDATAAEQAGFNYAGGREAGDRIWKQPALEILPFSPPGFSQTDLLQVGKGYGHFLAWVFGFQRSPDRALWEVAVDAHTGEVLSFRDVNHYTEEQIVGGVYPLTNTAVCGKPTQCGTMQSAYPMPFADTGLAAPNNFTNSGGVFDFTSGTVTTTLSGPFVNIFDNCGPVSESSNVGSLDLGGINGQHDCDSAGSSPGNTPSSRAGFYELNKLVELARGYLPMNPFLQNPITANMNISDVCNAFYSPIDGSINFFKSGSSDGTNCANTGEIAAVFDHEWGHALDDNDSVGVLSNSSEGYADIVGILRLQASCVGHGFFLPPEGACGLASDGTRNVDEDQTAGVHCAVDCSGVRDSDFALHADQTPDTPQNHVCGRCVISTGPCGRQVHCAAAPVRQAGWDLAARDLQSAPFNYDPNTAFIIANKIFYQGSGNVALWYACDCVSRISNGCNADSGYLQWLAADDDNGNVLDGTPHITAIFNAYNRHGIACSAPAQTNSGCAGAPNISTVVTTQASSNQIQVSWNGVPNAERYWVFRGEGFAGCNFGKALIAEVTNTSFTDTEVGNRQLYAYNIVAAGSSDACFGPASNCSLAMPQHCAARIEIDQTQYTCGSKMTVTVWDNRFGAGSVTVTVSSSKEKNETLKLTETPLNSGRYIGTIAVSGGGPSRGDGKIAVNNIDTIKVSYVDPDNCGKSNTTVSTSATATCNFCEGSQATGPNLTVLESSGQLTLGGGDGDSFIDNCEQAEFRFSVLNSGKNLQHNVRIMSATSSHPGVQIQTTFPKVIANRLASCATAEGILNFNSSGLSPGDTIELRIEVTSDELAPSTRSGVFRIGPAEQDLQLFASKTFSFEADREGWATFSGTFERSNLLGGANGTNFHLASSSLQDSQCDEVQSPVVELSENSTLRMSTRFDTEPCSTECYDRANVGIVDLETDTRTTVDPDGGSTYNASGANGTCVTSQQNGWSGPQSAFLESSWSAAALNSPTFAAKEVRLDIAYGTDTLISGRGFQFDELTLTNFKMQVNDNQPDACQ